MFHIKIVGASDVLLAILSKPLRQNLTPLRKTQASRGIAAHGDNQIVAPNT
jgi:hypothetical protein